MKQLIFIRHGSTAGNLEKRYIGRTDEPLCELGVRQIEALKAENFHGDFLFCSPMLRTRQTAAILFTQQSVTFVEDFRETDFGIFEGKTAAELSDSSEYRKWLDSFCLEPIPQGGGPFKLQVLCRLEHLLGQVLFHLAELALQDADGLATIVIPEGVTLLKNSSLAKTNSLKTVTVLGMETAFESDDVFKDNQTYPKIKANI